MDIRTLFAKLSYGELSNLSLGKSGAGSIDAENQPKLINYINEGLLRLHSKFVLKENSVLILQVGHITKYHFKERFAESSGSDEDFHYIKDLNGNPFKEDFIKALQISDDRGRNRPINDVGNPLSIFTPTQEMIQVPNPEDNHLLSVSYQARHIPLYFEGNDIDKQKIEIPFALEGALINYVAYKVYSHMNGQENQAKSAEFFNTFESICAECKDQDLVNVSSSAMLSKFEERGFV